MYFFPMSSLLSALNNKQQTAVKATEGPVLVLAGAGSGKTRTLVHRIAYLIAEKKIKPWNILAVTFTNKAANEMKDRVEDLLSGMLKGALPFMGTFHSVCVRILREDSESIGYKRNFAIYDTSDQLALLRRVMKELGYSTKEVHPNKVLGMISSSKNQLIGPADFKSDEHSAIGMLVSRVYTRYQGELKNANALDFDDLIMKTVELFRAHPSVLAKYHARWHYLLIDEYQDINSAQYVWSKLLSEAHKNIFAVGDDCQAIYAWRGADYRNILNFENDYPASSVVLLEQNYRSTQRILNLGNRVIKENQFQKDKALWTENECGAYPFIVEVENEYSEAEFIVRTIVSSHDKGKREEIVYEYEDQAELEEDALSQTSGILDKILRQNRAGVRLYTKPMNTAIDLSSQKVNLNNYVVLYRTNAQSRVLEEVLLEYAIPYRLIGGIKFYERKEVKDMVAFLSLIHNPRNTVSFERIVNAQSRGIGPQSVRVLYEFSAQQNMDYISAACKIGDFKKGAHVESLRTFGVLMRSLQEMCAVQGSRALFLSSALDAIGKTSGYYDSVNDGTDEGLARLENLKELKSVAKKYDDLPLAEGIAEFLHEVALIADIDSYNASEPALTLMTAHSAKGLEFPCVFMVGMEDGLFPHAASMYSQNELEEERRLCYVGITRAREKLYLVHARTRMLYGNTMFNLPSQFIRDLSDDFVERVYA